MTLHVLDHLFFFLIAVAMPVYGFFWLRKRAAERQGSTAGAAIEPAPRGGL
jgi:hypothetical protein